jgi:hypothetical protein
MLPLFFASLEACRESRDAPARNVGFQEVFKAISMPAEVPVRRPALYTAVELRRTMPVLPKVRFNCYEKWPN